MRVHGVSFMAREFYPGNQSDHDLLVYPSEMFRCVQGMSRGDVFPIDPDLEELCVGDCYRMIAGTDPMRIQLKGPDPKNFLNDSYMLQSDGSKVHADLCLTLMTNDGVTGRLRLLHTDAGCWLLPLGPLDLFATQNVISIDRVAAPLPAADPTCLAFVRGTRITLQDGSSKPIEDLTSGDMLLTRGGRHAPVVGVLRDKVPATGRNTRVVIREGALSNPSELIVSGALHVFMPARRDRLNIGAVDRTEPAFRLVNGLTITSETGGTTEYFHVLLDRHEIIYAEGVPCESFLLDLTARAGLADGLAAQVKQLAPTLHHSPNVMTVSPALRPVADAAAAIAHIRA